MKGIGIGFSNSIPKEIEFEILIKLPIKSLLRFKCICKLWKSVIENDPIFVSLHLANSNKDPSRCRVLISFTERNFDSSLCICSAILQGGPATHHLTLPGCQKRATQQYVYSPPCRCWVSESLNGIVCYYNDLDFYVCNPTMKKFVTLPRTQKKRGGHRAYETNNLFFGFDPSTKEYKVLNIIDCGYQSELFCELFTLRTDSTTGEVFKLDTDSWITISGSGVKNPREYCYPFITPGLCVNGAIHWVCKQFDEFRRDTELFGLVAFNLNREEFGFITLPEGVSSSNFDLSKVRDRLALLDYVNPDLIEMWVLEDYVNQLWINERSIEHPYFYSKVQNPISFRNDEMLLTPNVLLSDEYTMVPYHFKNQSVRLVRVTDLPNCFKYKASNLSISNHVESLSSLATKRLLKFGEFIVYINI